MNIPKAPLYGAFARAWALKEQGITVSFETATERHFKATVSWKGSSLPGSVLGDDPDNLLDQIEDTLVKRGVKFTRSRTYIEEVEAFGDRLQGIPNPGPSKCIPFRPCVLLPVEVEDEGVGVSCRYCDRVVEFNGVEQIPWGMVGNDAVCGECNLTS